MNSDETLLHDFLEGCLQRADLHHREHLLIVWQLARQHDEQTTLEIFATGIRIWSAQHNRLAQYNATLTRFWVQRVAQAVREHPEISDFDVFLAACPHLLDKNVPSI